VTAAFISCIYVAVAGAVIGSGVLDLRVAVTGRRSDRPPARRDRATRSGLADARPARAYAATTNRTGCNGKEVKEWLAGSGS